jgi:hypothetical protein
LAQGVLEDGVSGGLPPWETTRSTTIDKSKRFFFEKKKQKTFASWSRGVVWRRASGSGVLGA